MRRCDEIVGGESRRDSDNDVDVVQEGHEADLYRLRNIHLGCYKVSRNPSYIYTHSTSSTSMGSEADSVGTHTTTPRRDTMLSLRRVVTSRFLLSDLTRCNTFIHHHRNTLWPACGMRGLDVEPDYHLPGAFEQQRSTCEADVVLLCLLIHY